nr:MAG TPA: hypothetical protein [Caudoviricetes sp.]DAP80513.1 MAG TPA: hypothetical protein [Caudoviricetes sp.]
MVINISKKSILELLLKMVLRVSLMNVLLR